MTLKANKKSFPVGMQVKIPSPATEPVEVSTLKEWMQIDYSDHDAIIQAILRAMDNWLARYLNVISTERQVTVSFEQIGRNVELNFFPIKSIDEVVSIDEDGNEESKDYTKLRQDLTKIYITDVDADKQLRVKLTCGESDAINIREGIKTFLKEATLNGYEARGKSVATGEVAQATPSFETVVALSKRRWA